MPMPPYPILCTTRDCGQAARLKIAARWSDGITQELKTYALTCPTCLAAAFHRSRQKQAACRLTPGETLESPGIYDLAHGQRDQHLHRRPDLEQELLAKSSCSDKSIGEPPALAGGGAGDTSPR